MEPTTKTMASSGKELVIVFDIEDFVASCQAALKEHNPELAVKELMERTVTRPTEVEAALGTPTKGGVITLHHSPDLTVLNVIWAPHMSIFPHDHQLWAVIGIYGGQENNTFYRRNTQGPGLVRAGFKELQEKEAVVLGKDAIHAVHNPRRVFTGAIHVYGGDFFAQPRSEWDMETGEEKPYSVERTMRAFAEANDRWLAEGGASC